MLPFVTNGCPRIARSSDATTSAMRQASSRTRSSSTRSAQVLVTSAHKSPPASAQTDRARWFRGHVWQFRGGIRAVSGGFQGVGLFRFIPILASSNLNTVQLG